MTLRHLAASAPLLLVLLGAPSRAEPAGVAYHGAGGPFVSTSYVRFAGGPRLSLFSTGGSGFSYHLGGRLRLGGGGQGSVASSSDEGWTGSVGWGGLSLAADFLGDGIWELPVGLMLGGGRASLERVLASGAPERLERESFGFFTARLFAGVEARVARTLKLALHAGWQLGLHGGVAFQGAELSLQLVFLLPRPGY